MKYLVVKNKYLPLHRNRERLQDKNFGSVVQLVRIHACHAWGRGFESRPDRIFQNAKLEKALIPYKDQGFFCV